VCCDLAHQTVTGAPGPYRVEPATLGKTQVRSAIIHRTVRCATGLSGVPAEQRLSRATVDSDRSYSAAQKSEQQSQRGTGLSGAARGQSPNGRLASEP
jgi:hypothetical protein